ncbi:MAG: family peptidase, partial [Acidobacteria bacterium]|nr:family peptidase [Acidobacteriota bacterium]
RDFAPRRFGPARWLGDGSGYTTLEPSPAFPGSAGRDIVRYDPATGRREVMVQAAQLVPQGEKAPLDVDDYQWSADGRLLLVFTNTKRVWRRNTRGDYWVLDRKTGRLAKLGGAEAEPSTLMFAKLSPDATRAAYVRRQNLYVEDLATGRVRPLTTDGTPKVINGTFDWVYEEELDLRDGWRWSPDGRSIAYWQIDARAVKDFLLINNTDTLYPVVTAIPYPKVGEPISSARIGIVSAEGGETRWLQVPGDPADQYLARMEWAAGSDAVVLQRANRIQNTIDVMLGDAATGRVTTVITEKDEAWVDVGDDFRWLDGGKRFLWVSERDGWRHVYVVARDSRHPVEQGSSPAPPAQPRLVTPGAYDVIEVQQVDEKGGWLYFIASPDNATQRFLHRARLDGSGAPERLTPPRERGTHSYQLSPDGRWAIHVASSFGRPPVTDLVELPSHRVARVLEDNGALGAKVDALARGDQAFLRVPIGQGVELDGWVMRPPRMEAGKRYPVLVHVYGEPAGQTVLDAWGGTNYLWHLMLAQRGYIVLSVDNRGTPAPRGRAWRKAVYRQIGILAHEDQAAAVRAIATWPDVDASRVGVWGWSGGGSMTLNAMFHHPDVYRTGMAVAAVPDQRLYDATYQERYMTLPKDNPKGFEEGSPITHVKGLEGNLLIVHGTGDDNVHYQGFERLVNALVAANKRFTMMSYPNRTHSISEGPNTTRHLYSLLTRYLEEHVPPGPR